MSSVGTAPARRDLWRQAQLLLPGLLTAFLAFRAGGFFPGATGLVAAGLAVALAAYLTAARRPFAGLGTAWLVSAGALAGLAVWILLSARWSNSAGRALIEFDRALLYLLLLALFGFAARRAGDLGRLLRWAALVIAAVGLVALLTRLLPDQLPTSQGIAIHRLQFPLTYWNALGMLMGIGLVLNLHLSAAPAEALWARLLGAGSIPVLVVTLYFTFSRGAILAALAGIAAVLLLGPSRGLVTALISALPTGAFAAWQAYGAEPLADTEFTAASARPEAHRLLAVMAGCVVAAVALRGLGRLLDRRLARLRMPGVRAPVVLAVTVALIMGVGSVVAASGLVDRLERSDEVSPNDLRDRLTTLGDRNRRAHWRVAVDEFRRAPWQGTGAGTFRLTWERERPFAFDASDGHSLYLETLSELGIPGLAMLLVCLLVPLGVAAARLGGPERHAHAAFVAAGGALLVHAGIDWDWEMPALFVWFFAAAGVVLAVPTGRARPPGGTPALGRLLAGLACLLLAVTPALVALNQRHLNRAVAAFDRGDCGTTIDAALDSVGAFNVRADPFELLGYCDARQRDFALAVRAMMAAQRRDPGNWQYAYGLAVAQALAGNDPRPAAAAALRQNPLEELARGLDRRLRVAGSSRRRWFRVAARAQIPSR